MEDCDADVQTRAEVGTVAPDAGGREGGGEFCGGDMGEFSALKRVSATSSEAGGEGSSRTEAFVRCSRGRGEGGEGSSPNLRLSFFRKSTTVSGRRLDDSSSPSGSGTRSIPRALSGASATTGEACVSV